MRTSPMSPGRLLTVVLLTLALAVTMVAGYTISPAVPKASAALISAAKADVAADWARSRKGMPYQYGATGPKSFDCSGLTQWAYSRVGKALPRTSGAQARAVERIKPENRRRGDLVFYYNSGGVYHVSIYAGNNQIWHASRTGLPVKRDRLWPGSRFYGRVK